jgi:hypothetical protein
VYKDPADFKSASFCKQFQMILSHSGSWMTASSHSCWHQGGPWQVVLVGQLWSSSDHANSIGMPFKPTTSWWFSQRIRQQTAFPAHWADLNMILGGFVTLWQRQALTLTTLFCCIFYHKYVPLMQNVRRWKHKFVSFTQCLSHMEAPCDNLVSFIDGHFNPTLLPGSDACVFQNLWFYQM